MVVGMMPGPIALAGSGEYLPVMLDIERSLIAGRPPRYVQIATAASPEGPDVVAHWNRLGAAQADRLGVQAVPLPVGDRADAHAAEIVADVVGAGLIYLSGGNPAFLSSSLRDTPLWQGILDAWRAGAALAGCSAGAMALTGWAPEVSAADLPVDQGLGLLPRLRVLPHFDKLLNLAPELLARGVLDTPSDVTVIGIDEDTALVGGPDSWTVRGRQSVWILGEGAPVEHPAGSTLHLPSGTSLAE